MRLLIALAACLLSIGCATVPTTSSGFGNQTRATLPEGIPDRVQVHISGPYQLARQAEEQFAAALYQLGFEVVNGPEHNGEFIGNITAESSATWVDSHLTLRLVDALTQKVVWNVEAHDPRAMTWSYAPQTSTIYTTRAAIAALKKDLAKM